MDKAFFSLSLHRVHCHGMWLNRFCSVKTAVIVPFLKRWADQWVRSLLAQEFTCFTPMKRLLLFYRLLSWDMKTYWKVETEANANLFLYSSDVLLWGLDALDGVC